MSAITTARTARWVMSGRIVHQVRRAEAIWTNTGPYLSLTTLCRIQLGSPRTKFSFAHAEGELQGEPCARCARGAQGLRELPDWKPQSSAEDLTARRGSRLAVPAPTLSELRAMHEAVKSGQARRIREAAGLSGADVAREIDVNPAAVSRWETGQRVPRGAIARRYAQLLSSLAGAS